MIQSVWRQARSWGTRLGGQLSSQEIALSNARRASTQLSRRRVERDEVQIFLDDLDEPGAGTSASSALPPLPTQRAADPRA